MPFSWLTNDHYSLGDSTFILKEKETVSRLLDDLLIFVHNEYKVRMSRGLLSNGQRMFPSLAESGFETPDPEFIRIHTVFAKVLALSI